jgi:general secretion pathway protein C
MDVRHWFLRYSWVVNLVLIAGVSIVSARTLNGYINDAVTAGGGGSTGNRPTPTAAPSAAPAPVDQIALRDLFDAAEQSSGVSDASTSGASSEVKETTLRLKLLGTTYQETLDKYTIATIKNLQDQKTNVYRTGDRVADGATVIMIDIDRVLLAHNGGREELRLEEKGGKGAAAKAPNEGGGRGPGDVPIEEIAKGRSNKQKALDNPNLPGNNLSKKIKQVGENEYVIEKKALDDALADMNSIVTQARAIPNFVGAGDDRKVDGFRIYRIQPGSIYENLGIMNGDVIKSINGENMDSVEKALTVFSALRSESRFSITVQRQQNTMDMKYEVQ